MELLFCLVAGCFVVLALIALLMRAKGLGVSIPLKVELVILAAVLAAVAAFTPQFSRRLRTGVSRNFAVSSTSPEFPELKTRFYKASPQTVFDQALAVIKGFAGWKVTSEQRDYGIIRAERRLLIFSDDVSVKIHEDDVGSRVDVFSKSRVGTGDFGSNRRNVAQFLSALDTRISSGLTSSVAHQ